MQTKMPERRDKQTRPMFLGLEESFVAQAVEILIFTDFGAHPFLVIPA